MTKHLSNPFSTGSGGATFEHLVDTTYLTALLAENIPRGLPAGITTHVRFQARQAGVLLDDTLITSHDGYQERRLALQIKHTITFSSGDVIFREVMQAVWATYTNIDAWSFTPGCDRLGIAYGVGDSEVDAHLRPLLETARSTLSAVDFLSQISTPKFTSERRRRYLDAFRSVLTAAKGADITDDEVWQVLHHLVVLHFDLEHEGARDSTVAWNQLLTLVPGSDSGLAQTLFDRLHALAASYNSQAGTFDLSTLRQRVTHGIHLRPARRIQADAHRLADHSDLVFARTQLVCGGKVQWPRENLLNEVWQSLPSHTVTLLVGLPGMGKSAVLRLLAQRLAAEGQPLLFSAEDLDQPNLAGFFTNLQINARLDDLLGGLEQSPYRCILIDNLDHILTARHRQGLTDLITAVFQHNAMLRQRGIPEAQTWKVVATCRTDALEDVSVALQTMSQEHQAKRLDVIQIGPLDTQEQTQAFTAFPHLTALRYEHHLRAILEVPLFLDILTRHRITLTGPALPSLASEAWLAERFWQHVVRRANGAQPGQGEPILRETVALQIATRIIGERRWVDMTVLDAQAVQGLLEDKVLRREGNSVSFAHDVFADWTLMRILADHKDDIGTYLHVQDEPYVLERPLRLLAYDALERVGGIDSWQRLVATISATNTISSRWKALVCTAPLFTPRLREMLPNLTPLLLADDGNLLRDWLIALHSQATLPDPRLVTFYPDDPQRQQEMAPYIRIPIGTAWHPLLQWLAQHEQDLPEATLPQVAKTLLLWMRATPTHLPDRALFAQLAWNLANWEAPTHL